MNSVGILFARRHLRLAAAGLLLLAVWAGITSLSHAPGQPTHRSANWESVTNWENLH